MDKGVIYQMVEYIVEMVDYDIYKEWVLEKEEGGIDYFSNIASLVKDEFLGEDNGS
jgi:hypothetical protein